MIFAVFCVTSRCGKQRGLMTSLCKLGVSIVCMDSLTVCGLGEFIAVLSTRTKADRRPSSGCAASRLLRSCGAWFVGPWRLSGNVFMSYLNFGGGAGKSSTRAVFQIRLDSEVARELGGSSISILLDQEKCYGMVPFSCLWQEALSSDVSPTLCVGWFCRVMANLV